MKKLLIALAVMAATSSAFADGLSVSGGVGATTNEIWRGQSLSNKNVSANADVRVDYTGLPVDLFGAGRSATTNVAGVRSMTQGELGVGKTFGGVRTELGMRQYMFSGTPGSDINFREVFVRGSMGVAGGTLVAEHSKQVQGFEYGVGRPSYTSVGYSHDVSGLPLTVGAKVGYGSYNTGHKFNDLTLSAAYHLTKNVDVTATQTKGGHDAFGAQLPSQTAFGIRYGF